MESCAPIAGLYWFPVRSNSIRNLSCSAVDPPIGAQDSNQLPENWRPGNKESGNEQSIYKKLLTGFPASGPKKIRQTALAGRSVPLVQISVPQVQLHPRTPLKKTHAVTLYISRTLYLSNKTICSLPQSRETIPLRNTAPL
jgi:hypothetical protein